MTANTIIPRLSATALVALAAMAIAVSAAVRAGGVQLTFKAFEAQPTFTCDAPLAYTNTHINGSCDHVQSVFTGWKSGFKCSITEYHMGEEAKQCGGPIWGRVAHVCNHCVGTPQSGYEITVCNATTVVHRGDCDSTCTHCYNSDTYTMGCHKTLKTTIIDCGAWTSAKHNAADCSDAPSIKVIRPANICMGLTSGHQMYLH